MALRATGLYLTLDQQVVLSVARITGVANLPPNDVVELKKHQLLLSWAPGPGVEPGSRGHKADALPLSYPHTPQVTLTFLFEVCNCNGIGLTGDCDSIGKCYCSDFYYRTGWECKSMSNISFIIY